MDVGNAGVPCAVHRALENLFDQSVPGFAKIAFGVGKAA
jgi:hypothetical protein